MSPAGTQGTVTFTRTRLVERTIIIPAGRPVRNLSSFPKITQRLLDGGILSWSVERMRNFWTSTKIPHCSAGRD